MSCRKLHTNVTQFKPNYAVRCPLLFFFVGFVDSGQLKKKKLKEKKIKEKKRKEGEFICPLSSLLGYWPLLFSRSSSLSEKEKLIKPISPFPNSLSIDHHLQPLAILFYISHSSSRSANPNLLYPYDSSLNSNSIPQSILSDRPKIPAWKRRRRNFVRPVYRFRVWVRPMVSLA